MTQEEIIKAIRTNSNINQAIKDLVKDLLEKGKIRQNMYNRYKGKATTMKFEEKADPITYDGVPIFAREFYDQLKVNQKLHVPYARKLVNSLVGYFCKKIEIIGKGKTEEILQELLNTNDWALLNNDLVKNAAICGTSYIMLYNDAETGLQMKSINPWETMIIYDDRDEPQYGVRAWIIEWKYRDEYTQNRIYLELYDKKNVFYYIEDGQGNFRLYEEKYPAEDGQLPGVRRHFMAGIPIVEFRKNEDRIGDIQLTLSLQDAVDIKLSDLSSELSQLRLSYMYLKDPDKFGGIIDGKFLAKLQQTGILFGEWAFLEKNVNIDATRYIVEKLEDSIFKYSNSVDFTSKELGGDLPIIFFKLRFKALEDSAQILENYFRAAYRRLFNLVFAFYANILNRTGSWEEVKLVFNRNIPVNLKEESEMLRNLGMQISNQTLLENFSMIDDVDEELKRLEEESEATKELFFEDKNKEEEEE